MTHLGPTMRHPAAVLLVCLLRLSGGALPPARARPSSAAAVLLATYCLGAALVADAAASAAAGGEERGEQRTPSAGKLRSLGEAATAERRFPEAAEHYRRAVELEPDNALNFYRLFGVHKRMRALGDALDDITRAVELDGKTAWRLQKAKLLVGMLSVVLCRVS